MDVIALTVLYLLFIIFILQIIKWAYEHLALRKKLSSIPGPDSLPFIGLAWTLKNIKVEDLFEYLTELSYQYKNGMLITWNGTRPVVHIRKPHQVEIILRSRTLIGKGALYNYLAYWLGNGLLTSNGDVWHRDRRLITPAFHFNILDEFIDVIVEKAEILNECIKNQVSDSPSKKINIFPTAIKFTLDAVCKTVMGVDMDLQRKTEENEYVSALHKFVNLTMTRFMFLPFRLDIIFDRTKKGKEYRKSIKQLHAFTTKVIEERRKLRKTKTSQPDGKVENDEDIGTHKTKAFLDLLMDLSEADENPLSLEQIREQVDTFMFGGHDTTGIALSNTLFCLGNNPEVQKKVQEEINDVFIDEDEPITKQKLAELKYLERVIKESLRILSSVPSINRTLNHDVEIDNHTIPKGTPVNLQILLMHRDPDVWENPDTFNPDRFLENHHPYSFIPFSAGPRNCIGQKFAMLVLKISLLSVLRKWTVKSELKIKDLKLSPVIVLTPPNETLNLYFSPIKSNT